MAYGELATKKAEARRRFMADEMGGGHGKAE